MNNLPIILSNSLLSHLQTVCKSDNPPDAGLVGVHDRGLGDWTPGDCAVQEGSAVSHSHRDLESFITTLESTPSYLVIYLESHSLVN